MAIKRWSSKHIVVAAAIGTLAVVAIAVLVIISLTPPQILFSIKDAGINEGSDRQMFYNFTLLANNTSANMEVHYITLDTEIWTDPTVWYSVDMDMSEFHEGYVQSPQNVTKVPGWAEYFQIDKKTDSPQDSIEGQWPNCTVVVMANVLFKVGLARTRPYIIRVSCFPVNFVNQTLTPYTNCTY